jgi:hypothetical protein
MKFANYTIAFFIFLVLLFEQWRNKTYRRYGNRKCVCVGIIKADNQYTVYSTVNGILQKKKLLQDNP